MFKCGSYALLFALSLIGFSIGFSDSAGAQGQYDRSYVLVDKLYLEDTRYNCTQKDITNNFYTEIYDAEWNNSEHRSAFNRAFQTNEEPGRWTVSARYEPIMYGDGSEGSIQGVLIYFTEDEYLSMEIGYTPLATQVKRTTGYPGPLYRVNAYYNEDCELQVQATTVPLGYAHDGDLAQMDLYPIAVNPYVTFVDDDKITVPGGYGGDDPRTSIDDPGGGGDTIRPDFKYTIVDKNLSLSDHNQALPEFIPEEGYNMVEYLVEWTVTKCEGHDPDEDFEQQGLCKGSEYVTSDRLPQSDTFEYEVAQYGDYQLRAQYLIHQCYRYPSYPTTPDHCFYVSAGAQYEAHDWGETTKNVRIDGRTIIGDTALESCDQFDICTRPSQDSVISSYFQDKNASGLMMFLQAPIVFYQSLPAMTQSCTPITVPFLGGRTFELECLRPRYQQLSPFLYTMFQTVINGVVAYAVATKIFARIKNVNDPENDRIEVARL